MILIGLALRLGGSLFLERGEKLCDPARTHLLTAWKSIA